MQLASWKSDIRGNPEGIGKFNHSHISVSIQFELLDSYVIEVYNVEVNLF